ncbi:MAG: DUF983 domain-containing protein [Candidatus Poribacteria bacterium]|nr:DUF983 domain-containing protein [Candidatus Poribacteria bacterium]
MKRTLGNLKKILQCGFGLKCPQCEIGPLFQKRFTMYSHCTQCGLKFEREQGYFIGAMYINYGATVFLVFPGYFIFNIFTPIPFLFNFGVWGLVSAVFPVFFYRYSKSLWLNLDYTLNPNR